MLNYSTEAVLQGADLTAAREYLYHAYGNVTVAADLQDLVSIHACMYVYLYVLDMAKLSQ